MSKESLINTDPISVASPTVSRKINSTTIAEELRAFVGQALS